MTYYYIVRYEPRIAPVLTGNLARPDADYDDDGFSAYTRDAVTFTSFADAVRAWRDNAPGDGADYELRIQRHGSEPYDMQIERPERGDA